MNDEKRIKHKHNHR